MSNQYDEKIEAARAWMESRRIPQLGTEHLKTNSRRLVSGQIETPVAYGAQA